MWQFAAEVEDFSSARHLIQQALECLDELGLPMAAAYVDMAKSILEKHISAVISKGVDQSMGQSITRSKQN
jgi:hypothetical protein